MFQNKRHSHQPHQSPIFQSIFCTIRIENVVVIDIPNVFVQTDLIAINGKPVFVLMAIRGELADVLDKIVPYVYGSLLTKDRNGNSLLYVKLLKTLYGLVESSLMFYQKLRKYLEVQGFQINPYDPCVANVMVEGC